MPCYQTFGVDLSVEFLLPILTKCQEVVIACQYSEKKVAYIKDVYQCQSMHSLWIHRLRLREWIPKVMLMTQGLWMARVVVTPIWPIHVGVTTVKCIDGTLALIAWLYLRIVLTLDMHKTTHTSYTPLKSTLTTWPWPLHMYIKGPPFVWWFYTARR